MPGEQAKRSSALYVKTIVIDFVVAHPRWAHGGVVLADAHDGPPEVVYVLLLPRQDASVGHRDVDHGELSGVLFRGVARVWIRSCCIRSSTEERTPRLTWPSSVLGRRWWVAVLSW